MPPRHAYWTILVDEQPTAFRAVDQETLQPTFKRLQHKHPSARMVWFQNGKIWNSRLDAQEAMRARGNRGRAGDVRQRDRDPQVTPQVAPGFSRGRRAPGSKLEWKPRGAPGTSSPQAPKPPGPRRARPSQSGERRDRTWRPGGEHKDPRQKYKDAKKAKWGRFKQNIRKRWETKRGKKKDDE